MSTESRNRIRCVVGDIISAADVPQSTRTRNVENSRVAKMRNLGVGEAISFDLPPDTPEEARGEALDNLSKSLRSSAVSLPYRPRFAVDRDNNRVFVARDSGSDFVGERLTEGGIRRRVTASEQQLASAE